MSDDRVRAFLTARGAPDHVIEGGLEGLVDGWERTAANVADGYGLGLDDYLNDMDGRELIEDVLASVPEPDGSLLTRLRAADAAMRGATIAIRGSLWGAASPSNDPIRHWWYFSVPRRPGEDLADELEAAGLWPAD